MFHPGCVDPTGVDAAGLGSLSINVVGWAAVPGLEGTPVLDETVTAGCLRDYPVVPFLDRSATTG
jgi:hypothetical protein